jgi:hypothetical protein
MTWLARRRAVVFWLGGCLVTAGLVATTVRVQAFRYRPYLHDNLYLPSGNFIDQISLGYKQMSADMVWFSAILYYGEYRKGQHGLEYFSGLIDIVTRLDPHFIFAYVFGAWVVSEDMGDFQRGTEILKTGMAVNPLSWELPFEIGFLHFTNRTDYDLAARYLELASRMPNAPERARRFAAFVYSRGGESDSSIRLWEAYKEYTDNAYLKELADRYIQKLRGEQAIKEAQGK